MAFKEEPSTVRRPGRLSRLLTAALFLSGALFVLALIAPQTIGETARRQFLSRLNEHYPDYKISIGRGHFHPDVGLIFDDIRIADSSSGSFFRRSREMIRIERLTLVSDLHPEKLFDKQLPLTTQRIVIEGVQATAWLKVDGQLSLQDLMPLPEFGPVVPRIELRRTKLQLVDREKQNRPIDVELGDVLIHNQIDPDGQVNQKISIRGSADFAGGLMVQIDHNQNRTDVQAKISQAYLSRDLFDRIPTDWADLVQDAKDLQCVCDVALVLRRNSSGRMAYRFKTTVHQGRFNHPKLPQPITDLRGVFVCDQSGITINASHGVFGDAVVRTSGRIDGTRWPCDVDLQLSVTGLMLGNRLANALPPSAQAIWNKFQPNGRVDIVDAKLQHHDSQWKVRASVDCNAVDVRYEKFPYPLESLVGRIEIEDGIASSKGLSGRIGDSRLQCTFRNPIRPGITNEKSFVIATDNPVAIDNTLLRALSPRGSPQTKLETFIRSLRPRGTVRLASAVLSTDAEGRVDRKIDIRLIDGYVNYEKFAYPIGNITGKIEIDNDLVRLVGLQSNHANAGGIRCDGTFKMPPKKTARMTSHLDDALGAPAQSELRLNFVATDIPMDQSLRGSLPKSTQRTWDAISPSGVLDELKVSVTQTGLVHPVSLDITAIQHESAQITNRTLSLRPVSLPYRLDVKGGSVQFDGTKVTIHSLKGCHDGSTLSADGQCVRNADGRWELSLDLHSGSRLHPDAELIAAMPVGLRSAMRRLQLRGPVNLRGKIRIELPDATDPIPAVAWNLRLQLEGNRISDVGPIHSLRGEIAVRGVQDQDGPRAVGQVWIDSMHIDDQQVTGIEGPFSVSGDRLLLGSEARRIPLGRSLSSPTEEDGAPMSSIEGKLFGGKIQLDGHCILSTGNFLVGLSVQEGHLPTLLADFGYSDNAMTGTFQGQARLQGTLGNMDLLNGSGTARLSGANLYQLPLIVQVLNLLRVTPTEDVAFTDGKVEFAIDGPTMTFADLQLWGDLVALHGGGTLDRMRQLDLTFNTRVSPQNSFTQIIRPLRSKRYTLWTVDVRGPLHSLEIQRRALDGVGETLERLFPAMAVADRGTEEEPGKRNGSWFR